MSATIVVTKLRVWDKNANAERVVMLTTYIGFATRPVDTPPNVEVHGTVRIPASLRRDVVDKGLLTGPSAISAGPLVVENRDGTLDFLADCAFDGWECVIMATDDPTAIYPAEYTMLFNGTMEQMTRNDDEISVELRAVEYFADQPLQTVFYAGDNNMPLGLEGAGSDLKDQPKVLAYGYTKNMTPRAVNTELLIDHWHLGGFRDVQLYEGGRVIPADPAGDYADEAEMQAVAPLRGYFRKLKSGGYTRRSTAAAALITGDVWEGTWPTNRTTAQIAKRILLDNNGLAPSLLSAASFAEADIVQPATTGIDFKELTTRGDALDNHIKGQGFVRFSDNSGVIHIKRLDAPTGPPVVTFTDDEIKQFDQAKFGDNEAGLPVWKVNAHGIPLSTVQPDGLLGSVGTERRERLKQKTLVRTAQAPEVREVHRLARELTVYTRLMCPAALQAEADRLLALFRVYRPRYEAVIEAPFSMLKLVDLYSTVLIQRARYNMQAGVLCLVLGIQHFPEIDRMNLTLWGAP